MIPTDDVALYFPRERFGAIRGIDPIHVGLSGAAVYGVATESGDFILRVRSSQGENAENEATIRRLASDGGITPRLQFADETGRATVTERVVGPAFSSTLQQSESRHAALISLANVLARLHAVPTAGLSAVEPLDVAQTLWEDQRKRPGFPQWALPLGSRFVPFAQILEREERRVVSHNDLNPANILWDGARVWLVDWETAGLNHPYYDLATLSAYLTLPKEAALDLLARQEQSSIDAHQAEIFDCLCQLAALLYGVVLLRIVPDLTLLPVADYETTPTLAQCYAMMASGELDLQQGLGQGLLGTALLRKAVG